MRASFFSLRMDFYRKPTFRPLPEHLSSQDSYKELLDRASSVLQDRLMDVKISDDLEKASTASFQFSNTDRLLISNSKDIGGVPGADLVMPGNFYAIQHGYYDPRFEERRFSPIRVFTLTKISAFNQDTITVEGVSGFSAELVRKVERRVFYDKSVSEIVHEILTEAQIPLEKRFVQDTVYTIPVMIQRANETNLAFLYRLARPHNYYFYLVPGTDEGGIERVHFHKSGWTRTPSPLPVGESEVASHVVKTILVADAKFIHEGNANIARPVKRLRFRPPTDEEDNEGFHSFSGSFDVTNTPLTATASGIDTDEGTIVETTAVPEAKKAASLAPNTLFASDDPFDVEPSGSTPSDTIETRIYDGPSKGRRGTMVNDFFYRIENASIERAKDMASAALEGIQEDPVILRITDDADPDLSVGDLLAVDGLERFDGAYLLKRLTTTWSARAYTQDLEMTTDGVASATEKEAKQAKEVVLVEGRLEGTRNVVDPDGFTWTVPDGEVGKRLLAQKKKERE